MYDLSDFSKKIQNKGPIFNYYPPKNKYIGVISIPHSGLEVPEELKEYLTDSPVDLKQDVDFHVHKLVDIEQLQNAGIGIIKSNIIRTAVDLNRPKATTVLNWKNNSRGKQVVIKDIDAQTEDQIRHRYYSPYFEMLRAMINELQNFTSKPNVIDLHSMPSKATDYHLNINPNQKVNRPDFCVSDRSGLSCEKNFIDEVCNVLAKDYPNTTQNDPYFGGYITEYINDQYPEVNNIQIETNRSLYMNEDSFELVDSHLDVKACITKMILNVFEEFYQKHKINS